MVLFVIYILFPILQVTYENAKLFTTVLGGLATVGSIVYFFVRLYLEHKGLVKSFKLSEEMFSTLQKKNDNRHVEVMEKIQAEKEESVAERKLMRAEIELQRLRDREETRTEINRIVETLGELRVATATSQTTNQHTLEALRQVKEEISNQHSVNLKLHELLKRK